MVYGLGNTRGFGLRLMDYLQENGAKLRHIKSLVSVSPSGFDFMNG